MQPFEIYKHPLLHLEKDTMMLPFYIPSKTNQAKSHLHYSLGGKKKVPKSKPTTSGPNNKPLFLCNPFVSNMLVKGSFKTIVELPKYVDANEWLAFNSKQAQQLSHYCLVYNSTH
jgi:hypothetical protein